MEKGAPLYATISDLKYEWRKLPAKLREWFSKWGFLLNDEVDDYGAAAFNILQVKGLVGWQMSHMGVFERGPNKMSNILG